jgi:DNA-directed RNA polymerase specialized sigma subunit
MPLTTLTFFDFTHPKNQKTEELSMQHWQKDRNYRKYAHADGSFTYVITVDGTDVEVSEDVYRAYSQEDRRERYHTERDTGRLLSFDGMDEADGLLSYLKDRYTESAEETAIRGMLTERMMDALDSLTADERELIEALFWGGVPAREFARMKGVYHRTVTYRRDRILEKLLRLMEK